MKEETKIKSFMKAINTLLEKTKNTPKIMIMENIGKEEIIAIEGHSLKNSFKGTRDLELNINMLKDNLSEKVRNRMKKMTSTMKLFQNRADVLLRNLKVHL